MPGAEHHSQILRHDGTAWRAAPLSGFPGESALFAVDAVSGDEAWAAGASYPPQLLRSDTLVARWDGSTWASEATPNGNPSSVNQLCGVAAAGGTVWAVGSHLEPGSSYNRRALILQRAGGGQLTDIVALTASNIVAVGTGGNGGTSIVLHWNGTSWTREAAPNAVRIGGAAAAGPNTFWAVGNGFALNAYQERNFTMLRT